MLAQGVDIVAFQEVRFSTAQHPTRRRGSQLDDLRHGLPDFQFVYQSAHIDFPYG